MTNFPDGGDRAGIIEGLSIQGVPEGRNLIKKRRRRIGIEG
jgi:hypothetical protein